LIHVLTISLGEIYVKMSKLSIISILHFLNQNLVSKLNVYFEISEYLNYLSNIETTTNATNIYFELYKETSYPSSR